MTVQSVTRMWSKTGGQGTSEKYDAFASQFSLTDGYSVVCDIGDTVPDIEASLLLPQYGDQHFSGADAYVRSKNTTQVSPILYVVIVGYEGSTFNPNVDVEWTDSTSTEPIDRDYDGAAIVTFNNEPVEGLSMEIADPVCVISRKFFTVDTFAVGPYRHATNSDTFLGWPPGTARLIGYSARNQFKFGLPLEQWDVTARIQFRYPLAGATSAQAWYKRWRHEGLWVRDGLFVRRAIDDLGQEVTKPVLLKADGTQETNPNAAVFNYTQVYGSLPYSALGLI